MKTFKKSLLALIIVLAVSVNLFAQQNKDAAQLLKDEQKKEEIFSAILNDEQLKEDLMARMMADDRSRSMMMEDGHMMDKAENDDAMCKKMCMMMMDSDKMMDMMDNMKNDEESAKPKNQEEESNRQNHLENEHRDG